MKVKDKGWTYYDMRYERCYMIKVMHRCLGSARYVRG